MQADQARRGDAEARKNFVAAPSIDSSRAKTRQPEEHGEEKRGGRYTQLEHGLQIIVMSRVDEAGRQRIGAVERKESRKGTQAGAENGKITDGGDGAVVNRDTAITSSRIPNRQATEPPRECASSSAVACTKRQANSPTRGLKNSIAMRTRSRQSPSSRGRMTNESTMRAKVAKRASPV